MFVGHYGVALALCGSRRSPPLAAGFVAVQAIDFGFFGLSLAGIERWRSNPDLPGLNPFDLTFMPYTHGLAGTGAWALAAGLLAALVAPAGRRAVWGLVIAVLVMSHWGLDLLVHRPDLPLLADTGRKYGFALWNLPMIAIPLEMAVLAGGLGLYLRRTRATGRGAAVALAALIGGLLVLQSVNWFGPAITDPVLFPVAGLMAYVVATGLALWVSRTREPRDLSPAGAT